MDEYDAGKELRRVWTELGEGFSDAAGFRLDDIGYQELDVAVPSGNLALGRDSQERALLLIPVGAATRLPPGGLSTEALSVGRTIYKTEEQEKTKVYVHVILEEHVLWDVFVAMIQDFIRRLADSSGIIPALREALDEFRRLVSVHRARPGDLYKALGLYGELLVARRLAKAGVKIPQCWVGPLGDVHDFRVGKDSIEVKTCMVSSDRRVTIHGIDQLAPPTDGQLLFALNVVHEVETGGESLGELADNVKRLSRDSAQFDEHLARLGMDPMSGGPDLQRRFMLDEQFWYQVVEGFPRLTRSELSEGDLPPEVGALRYELSLGATTPGRMGEAEVDEWLNREATR